MGLAMRRVMGMVAAGAVGAREGEEGLAFLCHDEGVPEAVST